MTDKIYRSKINRLIQELKAYTSLPLKDSYNVFFRNQTPPTQIGNLGDWAVNLSSGTLFLRTTTAWKPIEGLVPERTRHQEIFKTSATRPKTPRRDRNPGWSTRRFDKADYQFTSLWSSRSLFIGEVRISTWSVPTLVVKGTQTDQPEPLRLTTHFIYNSSTKRPQLQRRANDPTDSHGWTRDRSAFKNRNTPVWMSRAQLDQHGRLHGFWSVPIQVSGEAGKPGEDGFGLEAQFEGENLVISSTKPGVGPIIKKVTGEDGKKVILEYDEVNNKFVQRYEGESETTDLATRETIVGTELIQLPGRVSQAETELSNKLNASDIADWAKEPAKPTYTASEVGARPESWKPSWLDVENKPDVIIEGDSRLTDSRPASDVPAWAKKQSLDSADLPKMPLENMIVSWTDIAGDTIVDDIGIAVDSMVPKSWIGIESGQIRRNFQNNDHYLQRSFNLNDLPNKATARSNLGLGTMALQNVENYSTTTQANVLYVGKSTNETISGVKTFGGANTAFSNGITLGSIVNIRPLNIRQNSDSDDVARILCWKTSGDAYLRFRFTSSDGGLDTFSTMLGASRRSASDYRTVLGSATSSSNASIKASLAGNGTFHVAGDVVAFSNNV